MKRTLSCVFLLLALGWPFRGTGAAPAGGSPPREVVTSARDASANVVRAKIVKVMGAETITDDRGRPGYLRLLTAVRVTAVFKGGLSVGARLVYAEFLEYSTDGEGVPAGGKEYYLFLGKRDPGSLYRCAAEQPCRLSAPDEDVEHVLGQHRPRRGKGR